MAADTDTTDAPAADSLVDHRTRERVLGASLYAIAGLLVAFLWIPLVVMIVLSVSVNASTFVPFEGFTLAHYAATLTDSSLLASVRTSAVVATVSATIATVLGVLASLALARYDFRLKSTFRTFGILPMIIPGVVLGIALLIYFRSLLGITPGFLTLVLTHSVYGFPFVVLIVSSRLYGFDESLEEAARDLGAGPVATFREITLPIIAPAVGAGFLFAWIRSFEDFIRAFFVKGTLNVLTTTMFSMIRFGAAPKMNAISSLVVFVVAVLLALAMNVGNVTEYVAGTHDE